MRNIKLIITWKLIRTKSHHLNIDGNGFQITSPRLETTVFGVCFPLGVALSCVPGILLLLLLFSMSLGVCFWAISKYILSLPYYWNKMQKGGRGSQFLIFYIKIIKNTQESSGNTPIVIRNRLGPSGMEYIAGRPTLTFFGLLSRYSVLRCWRPSEIQWGANFVSSSPINSES